MAFENILVTIESGIGLIQLNRPKVLNALSSALMIELGDATEAMDRDPAVHCIVIHGSERAFSAGADIDQMKSATPVGMIENNWINLNFGRLRRVSKPIIAAVSGYCLGGGCELAMTCDMIIASESALTGKFISAREAEARGLVSRVVPVELYLEEAKALAREIASKSPVAVRFAKEAVNKVYELPLGEGLDYESRLFYMLFSTEDQKEGMAAFVEKRKAEWKGK